MTDVRRWAPVSVVTDQASRRPLEPRAVFRLFDIAIALIALVVFLPLIALLVLAMSISSRGPVLFAHQRVGRYGKMFPCLKFRTMRVDADRVLAELLDRKSTRLNSSH